MSGAEIRAKIEEFFAAPPPDCGSLTNERSLQLELASFFRYQGWAVKFEVPFRYGRLEGSTLKPKANLDLLVQTSDVVVGIELKVPVNGQHPETIYAFCADLEFVEAVKRASQIHFGFCIMATNDSVFWTDTGRGSAIHNRFRSSGLSLRGRIEKPTGAKDTCVMLQGEYVTAALWRQLSPRLMSSGRYLLVDV